MTGGTIIRQKARPRPDFIQVHGHSWFQFQTGPSGYQDSRVDGLLRSAWDVEFTGLRNRALSGAKIIDAGRANGGWSRAVTVRGIANRLAPYAPDGGATIVCYGWNDAAAYGLQNTACRQTMVDVHRAIISRCRASSIWYTDNAARWTWVNWTQQASGLDSSSGGLTRSCGVTTTNSATLTLPADFDGGVVAVAFLLRGSNGGASGATVTISGTAGQTGTFYNGGGIQSNLVTSYTVKRFTTLTAANAGQTIVFTVTNISDPVAPTSFIDSAWVESKTPPPVIVCGMHKSIVNGASYGYYGAFNNTWSATSTRSEAAMDADVDSYNTLLQSMINEFDGMVQYADCNEALNPGGVKGILARTSDGVHPNEFGAGPIVDQIELALQRMTQPAGAYGLALGFNGPSPRQGGLIYPHPIAIPYNGPPVVGATYTAAAPGAVGDLWAFPFVVSGNRETYMNLSLRVVVAGSVQSTYRWAVYDDIDWGGYPGLIVPLCDTTSGAAFGPGLTTGMRDSASLVSGFGMVADPGLYWMVVKVDTVGTSQTIEMVTGTSLLMPNRIAAGTAVNAVGYKLTGQGTAALPSTFPAGGIPTAGPAPALSLKRTR